MNYFDESGRRVPTSSMRVFNNAPNFYYQLKDPQVKYSSVLERLDQAGLSGSITLPQFKEKAEAILNTIKQDSNYSNLLNGVHIPFAISIQESEIDLGRNLEDLLLPKLKESFSSSFPDCHFRAVLQSDSALVDHISLCNDSRYHVLVDAAKTATVVGWYFPQAIQEFDVDSQRRQMSELPMIDGADLCLSGGLDICTAVTGTPSLLVNEEAYPPILCMSAYQHEDPRMVLLLKSYGPHLEFWCMSQMLSKGITQVSEQWAGGLTVFSK